MPVLDPGQLLTVVFPLRQGPWSEEVSGALRLIYRPSEQLAHFTGGRFLTALNVGSSYGKINRASVPQVHNKWRYIYMYDFY